MGDKEEEKSRREVRGGAAAAVGGGEKYERRRRRKMGEKEEEEEKEEEKRRPGALFTYLYFPQGVPGSAVPNRALSVPLFPVSIMMVCVCCGSLYCAVLSPHPGVWAKHGLGETKKPSVALWFRLYCYGWGKVCLE